LEPVRQHARDYLEASGEAELARRKHAVYHLKLAEEAHWAVRGPQQREWLSRLARELDNVRAALGWAIGQGEIELGLRLAAGLGLFWIWDGHLAEGLRSFETFLARPEEASPEHRALALAW